MHRVVVKFSKAKAHAVTCIHNHGQQTAGRSGSRWLGAIRLPYSVRNMLRTEPVRADAAGMPFSALPSGLVCIVTAQCSRVPTRRLQPDVYMYVCVWYRSSTVVNVTYLEDHTLFFDGALATMLGMCTGCGKRSMGAAEAQCAAQPCRYKKTIICQEVAKAKNVCQVCFLSPHMVQVEVTVRGVQCWLL